MISPLAVTSRGASLLFRASLLVFLMLISIRTSASGLPLRVALVPLDNRPVCLSHVRKMAAAAGQSIAVPPYSAIGASTFPGDPDAVLDWMEAIAPQTDVMILSIEMAAQGGLVPSRTDAAAAENVMRRLGRIERMAAANPHLEILAFGVLQRIARTGTGKDKEDNITAMMANWLRMNDEAEARKDTALAVRAAALKSAILSEDIEAYLAARKRNHAVNIETIRMAARGSLDFLVIGMDDNAVYGPQRPEKLALEAEISSLGAGGRAVIKPGADELAQLLLARALLKHNTARPAVFITASNPASLNTIPPLEDRPLAVSAAQALEIAGGRIATRLEDSDAVLVVHSDEKDNAPDAALAAKLLSEGKRVSVADTARLNQGSAEFAEALGRATGYLARLSGYGGWNTAANAIGTAVTMLLLDSLPGAASGADKHKLLMFERFSDDAIFMGRVRPELKLLGMKTDSASDYIRTREKLVSGLRREAGAFYTSYFGPQPPRLDVQIPWLRLFEIDVAARPAAW